MPLCRDNKNTFQILSLFLVVTDIDNSMHLTQITKENFTYADFSKSICRAKFYWRFLFTHFTLFLARSAEASN